MHLTSLEICAGAGGQALGLEQAGFDHVGLVEIEQHACNTLTANRPEWNVVRQDVRSFRGEEFRGIDLLAGGVPCPPFSIAGQQNGERDERDLFPEALRLVKETNPRAVMLENVRGLLTRKFDKYRSYINGFLESAGYTVQWRLLQACDYGVAQLRPRALMVALRPDDMKGFNWPEPGLVPSGTVGEVLFPDMASRNWEGAEEWAIRANRISPTLVGGSRRHGGPDLGPTRARKQWATLGVDGSGLADQPPPRKFAGMPKLTVKMTAKLQGFPDDWSISGGKTASYRQVGNAFPPPVARAVGDSLRGALKNQTK